MVAARFRFLTAFHNHWAASPLSRGTPCLPFRNFSAMANSSAPPGSPALAGELPATGTIRGAGGTLAGNPLPIVPACCAEAAGAGGCADATALAGADGRVAPLERASDPRHAMYTNPARRIASTAPA